MEDTRERNRQIYIDRLNNMSLKEIADKYNISEKKITPICKRVAEKEKMQSTELYQIIQRLYEDERFVTRTYNILCRLEAETKEEILKLDRKTLLRTRNCGNRMTELILEMQEMIRDEDVLK